MGFGKMVGEDQPEKFHENSDTSFDNYPLLQVDFSMGKEKYINRARIDFFSLCLSFLISF